MDGLIFIAIVVWAIYSSAKRKSRKKQAANRRPVQQARPAQPAQPGEGESFPQMAFDFAEAEAAEPASQPQPKPVMPAWGPWDMPGAARAARQDAAPAPSAQPPVPGEGQGAGGSMGRTLREGSVSLESQPVLSGEGRGAFRGSLEGTSSEGMRMEGLSPSAEGGAPHVVAPFTESRHSHTESSMTGDTPCPPERRAAAPAAPQMEPSLRTAYGLSFDRQSLVAGFLYGEILNRPKALRNRTYGYRR